MIGAVRRAIRMRSVGGSIASDDANNGQRQYLSTVLVDFIIKVLD